MADAKPKVRVKPKPKAEAVAVDAAVVYADGNEVRKSAVDTIKEMSRDQLSMIASHLAAGRVLCCGCGDSWIVAVTSNEREQSALHDFAHEALGCYVGGHFSGHLMRSMRDDEIASLTDTERSLRRRATHYLDRFLELA